MVVAHPDDEIMWGGGLLVRHKHWDVICMTIPEKDPERIRGFEVVCRILGSNPVRMDLTEKGFEPEGDFSQYDFIVTHNEDGEYGHPHHKKVHEYIRNNFDGVKWYFGYGKGDIRIELSDDEYQEKLEALKHYNHQSITDHGLSKWEALLKRYPFDKIEYYRA